MSAFVDGYNAMDQSYARAAQRALLQREYDDKVAERNRLLAERDATRALMGSGIDTMSRTADDTQQFFDRYGLTPQYDPAFADANPRAAAYGLRRGDGPTMQAPTPEPAPMPTAKPNPLRERGLQAMRLGQSTGNMDLYLQGQRAVDALDMQSGASNVYQAVLGADQRTLDAFANKFTAHTKIPGNMVVGKDGITRLTFDDGKAITMDRGQLAQYVTALYRMDKGDATAIKDIGAINTELASRASDAFKNMHTVATTNNQATGIARQMQHYGTLEARAGAAAAERKAVMDAAKPYLDKYEQLSDADKNGPAGVSLLRQAQVAAARKSGDLNQVVQGLLPRGKAGDGKPTKVEEPGVPYLVDGVLKYSDGRGGYIAEGGVLPEQRTEALTRAGVPDNLVGQLPWDADGRHVGFAGRAYDVSKPEDMRELRTAYERLSANEVAATEARTRDYHSNGGPFPDAGANQWGFVPLNAPLIPPRR